MFTPDAPVLVTGGTGFVGRYLVHNLLARGARVRVPVHRCPPAILDDRVEYVTADLTRREDCRRVMVGMRHVVHAAGGVGAAGLSPARAMEPLTLGLVLTAQVLEAAWNEGVERVLIYSSSTGYPDQDRPMREDDFWTGPPHPAYFGYGWMRRYLERLSEYVDARSDTRVAIVRPTAIYGPHDNFDLATCHVLPALIRKVVEGQDPLEVWGTGNDVRDFLHVDDLARGSLLALEHAAGGPPVNIGLGQGYSIRQCLEMILEAAGRRPQVIFNSDRPSTIPVRLVDTTRAREHIGFVPRYSLADGLAETVRWYAETRGVAAPAHQEASP